jgi:Bacterial SH3 domain
MKRNYILILLILTISNLYGIERYTKGDSLYVWATNLNLREFPNLESRVIHQISENEKVIVNETKYDKYLDATHKIVNENWKKLLTGKWVEVNYQNKTGYVFDAYLSKYSKDEILKPNNIIWKDSLIIPVYEKITRYTKEKAIIYEEIIGNEWWEDNFIIPEFSIEESILLLKEKIVGFTYEEQNWTIKENMIYIEIIGLQSLGYRYLTIQKFGNYIFLNIEEGL